MSAPLPRSSAESHPEAQKKVIGFKTSKGSVYTYDDEGKTTRFKATSGELRRRKDITVFLPLAEELKREFIEALTTHTVDHEVVICIVERQPDNSVREISDIADIQSPNSVYLAIVRDGELVRANQVSLIPVIGYNVFDTRYSEEDGETRSYPHLGNNVTEILYE